MQATSWPGWWSKPFSMNKAAFLDRDGVINRKARSEDSYITCWDEFEILPGVAEAIALLNRLGYFVIIATNQRSIAKGVVRRAELDAIHQRMCESLLAEGAKIDAVYYCPHEIEPPCGCRKPQPGMLFEAARTHDIELKASWMIGDSDKDVEAGKRAGCKTVRLVEDGKPRHDSADIVASSLLDAALRIVELGQQVPLTEMVNSPPADKEVEASVCVPGYPEE